MTNRQSVWLVYDDQDVVEAWSTEEEFFWNEMPANTEIEICGDRVYRTAQGKWRHCYYPRETRCKNGKRIMGKKE